MMKNQFTKEEIREALCQELIESYGGLSKDKEGNELGTPYMVLGIFEAAWSRLLNPSQASSTPKQ